MNLRTLIATPDGRLCEDSDTVAENRPPWRSPCIACFVRLIAHEMIPTGIVEGRERKRAVVEASKAA